MTTGKGPEALADERPYVDKAMDRFGEHPAHDRLIELLEEYSPNGQRAMVSFLYFTDDDGALDRGVEVLEQQHEEHWRFQNPEMRGDPEANISNKIRFKSMFSQAGIQFPRLPQAPEN